MENDIIIPKSPYIFRSGKHMNEFAEDFVFYNTDYLLHVNNREHHANDALERHLRFIYEAGTKLKTKKICPFCLNKPVRYFVFNSYLFLEGLTCCEDALCKEHLKSLHPELNLVPFFISSLGNFKNTRIREKAEVFFRKIYGIKRRPSAQQVLNLLRSAVSEPELFQAQPLSLRKRIKKPDAIQKELMFQ